MRLQTTIEARETTHETSRSHREETALTCSSVFGLGPVGLVTAVCFVKSGHLVIGIDPDRDKLEKIRKAEPPGTDRIVRLADVR